MPTHYAQPTTRHQPWDGDVQDLKFIGNGASGIVFAIDSDRVAKIHLRTPRSIEDFETERAVYRRFNRRLRKVSCRCVLRCLETENSRGLVFERCRETLRDRLRRTRDGVDESDDGQALRWAKQAAKGLAWVHDCKVIQGDVGCHNMLLDLSDTIKLADFAGSSIDESKASINYEARSQLPDVRKPTKKSDIFALGSAMYEMATGHPPYETLPYKEVQNKYRKRQWPEDVDRIKVLGKIIRKCWEQEFANAWDVVRVLGETQSQSQHRRPSELQQRVEVFNDSAISMADTAEPEPDTIAVMAFSKASRRRRNVPTTYVQQTSHHESRRGKDGQMQRKKKQSHGGFFSWINRSIHPRTHYERDCHYRVYE